MPRTRSSVELDAEIQELKKKLAEKQRAAQAAKRREKAEAEQIRAYEEARFNKEFVSKAKEVRLSDHKDDGRTVFELIESLIHPPVSPEPVEEDEELERIDLTGYDPTKGLSLTEIMKRNGLR